MDTALHTFAYAEASIAEHWQREIASILALVVIIVPSVLVSPRIAAVVLGLLVLGVVPITYLRTRWLVQHFRRLRVHLLPDALIRESGTRREVLPWNAIRRLRIRQYPNGRFRAVEVYAVAKRPVTLAGFEHMEAVIHGIEAQVPRAIIETKRDRLSWYNPRVVFGVGVYGGLIGNVLFRIGGDIVVLYVIPVVLFGAGLWCLSYAPLSKQNPNFRPYEVGIGGLVMGLAIFILLLSLSLPATPY